MKQKEMNKLMNEYHNEMVVDYSKQVKKDNLVLDKVCKISSNMFYNDLLDFIMDNENGITGYYEIVDEPKGEYQEEDLGLIQGVWVDQYTTEMIGDDYHGYLTVKLENEQYFQCSFEL